MVLCVSLSLYFFESKVDKVQYQKGCFKDLTQGHWVSFHKLNDIWTLNKVKTEFVPAVLLIPKRRVVLFWCVMKSLVCDSKDQELDFLHCLVNCVLPSPSFLQEYSSYFTGKCVIKCQSRLSLIVWRLMISEDVWLLGRVSFLL